MSFLFIWYSFNWFCKVSPQGSKRCGLRQNPKSQSKPFINIDARKSTYAARSLDISSRLWRHAWQSYKSLHLRRLFMNTGFQNAFVYSMKYMYRNVCICIARCDSIMKIKSVGFLPRVLKYVTVFSIFRLIMFYFASSSSIKTYLEI